ncbi:MAG: Crp/Fnr family transcriptional regulator [Gammaproteobacteria bacterium]|nr:Crp/Fnr family transcriptional regulator [Gammaproteobacteria bacterium]
MSRDAKIRSGDVSWLGRADCTNCPIRVHSIFSPVPDESFATLLAPIDHFGFGARTTLYQLDERGDSIYTLRSGLVKLVRYLPKGVERIVRLVRPGGVAGLELLVDGRYHHTAVAVQESEACRIPVVVLRGLKQRHPEVHRELVRRWQETVDEADRFITAFATGAAPVRMARLLLQLCGDEDPSPISARVGRDVLAGVLGISTETASRIMADFKRRGLVEEEEGHFRCANRAGLEALARDP